jgi:hypothetical protein
MPVIGRHVLRSSRDETLMVSDSIRDVWTSDMRNARKFNSYEDAQSWLDSHGDQWTITGRYQTLISALKV